MNKNGRLRPGIEKVADLTARVLERIELNLCATQPSAGKVTMGTRIRTHTPFLAYMCEGEDL